MLDNVVGLLIKDDKVISYISSITDNNIKLTNNITIDNDCKYMIITNDMIYYNVRLNEKYEYIAESKRKIKEC